MLVEVVDPYRAPLVFGTIRTVSGAGAGVGHVFPRAEQTATELSPFSGPVVRA